MKSENSIEIYGMSVCSEILIQAKMIRNKIYEELESRKERVPFVSEHLIGAMNAYRMACEVEMEALDFFMSIELDGGKKDEDTEEDPERST